MDISHLVQPAPKAIGKALQRVTSPGETQLRGTFKEVLICTDRRILTVKNGFMAGHTFGSDVFQQPYSLISSAEVVFNILSGYFEVASGGMQNTRKSYWAQKGNASATRALNAISPTNRDKAAPFREAATWIMSKVDEVRRPQAPSPSSPDLAAQIERLWALVSAGAMSTDEFDAAKTKLIS